MLHTDGGQTSSRNNFNHRPWPSSPDNRVLYKNVSHERLSQFIKQNIAAEIVLIKDKTENMNEIKYMVSDLNIYW